ncbi:MAG: YnfA family protein [Vicinamibacterales bacterium]
MPPFVQSVSLFVIAGLCEIGGGWLVWQYWRNGAAWPFALAGAVALLLYGIVPTYQPAHFGRVYAAYGGAFIALSLIWGAIVDGNRPDGADLAGAAVALAGMAIIMYWPR